MREVWQALVDFDGTTRSHYSSIGLFATRKLAEEAIEREHLLNYQSYKIVKLQVHGTGDA